MECVEPGSGGHCDTHWHPTRPHTSGRRAAPLSDVGHAQPVSVGPGGAWGSSDFLGSSHVSVLLSATCSLPSLPTMPCKSRWYPEGCRDTKGHLATVQPNTSCCKYRYPSLMSFFGKKYNQNSVSVANTIFSKEGVHGTKEEGRLVPL